MKIPQQSSVPEKSEQAPGLEFPCAIDVKIFINNQAEDEGIVRTFVMERLKAEQLLSWSSRESSGGKYLAITVRVHAQSRAHIDELYQALNAHETVIMLI